jgi:hypothetical protein
MGINSLLAAALLASTPVSPAPKDVIPITLPLCARPACTDQARIRTPSAPETIKTQGPMGGWKDSPAGLAKG